MWSGDSLRQTAKELMELFCGSFCSSVSSAKIVACFKDPGNEEYLNLCLLKLQLKWVERIKRF